LIVHNQDISNQFFQEFIQRFSDLGGNVGLIPYDPEINISVEPLSESINLFNVHPNPADQMTILNGQGIMGYQVIDILGKVVTVQKMDGVSNNVIINTNELHSGMYFLKVQTQQGEQTAKLMIN